MPHSSKSIKLKWNKTVSNFLFHHCTNFDAVVQNKTLYPNPEYMDKMDKRFFSGAFKWLEKQCGFYPLFMAVGNKAGDLHMTGYQDNWRKLLSWSKDKGGTYRRANEYPNLIVFSYNNLSGIFTDYDAWHIVLNSQNYEITEYEKRLIFKPSWNRAKWLNNVKKNPGRVQMVVPYLKLTEASEIWTRNKNTAKKLKDLGFKNIKIMRLPVNLE